MWADRLTDAAVVELVRAIAAGRAAKDRVGAEDALGIMRALRGADHASLLLRDADNQFRVRFESGRLPSGVRFSETVSLDAGYEWMVSQFTTPDAVVTVPSLEWLARQPGTDRERQMTIDMGVERGFLMLLGGAALTGVLTASWVEPAEDEWQPDGLRDWRILGELLVGLLLREEAERATDPVRYTRDVMYDSVDQALVVVRASDMVVVDANAAARTLSDLRVQVGEPMISTRHQRFDPATLRPLEIDEHPSVRVASGELDVDQRHVMSRRSDGTMVEIMVWASAIDVPGAGRHVFIAQRPMSEADEFSSVHGSRLIDPATKVGTPEMLPHAFEWARRVADRDGIPLRLAVVDPSGVDRMNDDYAVPVVNDVLAQVTARLGEVTAPLGTVVRHSPSLFAVICLSGEPFEALAGKLCSVFEEPYAIPGRTIRLRGTVGVCSLEPGADLDLMTVVERAQFALLDAKRDGAGAVEWTPECKHRSLRIMSVAQVDDAFTGGEMESRLWPIVTIRDRKVAGAEVTTWWNHPVRGLLYPQIWRDEAVEFGGGDRLFKTEVRYACWALPSLPDRMFLNVRVGAGMGFSDEHAQMVLDALKEFGVRPHRLQITFGVDALTTKVVKQVGRLKGHGVRIGYGFDGTADGGDLLHQVPGDMFVLERPLMDSEHRRGSGISLEVTVGVASRVGIPALLRDVEWVSQAERLVQSGATHAQGFSFHMAVGLDEFRNLI